MIRPETYTNCTILQAVEWIAFKWVPTDENGEVALNHIRPQTILPDLSHIIPFLQKPSIAPEEYFPQINRAKAFLAIAIAKNELKVSGTDANSTTITDIQGTNPDIKYENNTITINDCCFNNIKIDFKSLSLCFPSGNKRPGRQGLLTPAEINKVKEYANHISKDQKISNKTKIHKCIDFIKQEFDTDVSFNTVDKYLK